jgi:hypothetical protein
MTQPSNAPPKLVALVGRCREAVGRVLAAHMATTPAGLGRAVVVVMEKPRRGVIFGVGAQSASEAETDEAVLNVVPEGLLEQFARRLPEHARDAAAWLNLRDFDAVGCLAVSPTEAFVGSLARDFGVAVEVGAPAGGFSALTPEADRAIAAALPWVRSQVLRYCRENGLRPPDVAARAVLVGAGEGTRVSLNLYRREKLAGGISPPALADELRKVPPDGHCAWVVQLGDGLVLGTLDVVGDPLAAPRRGGA